MQSYITVVVSVLYHIPRYVPTVERQVLADADRLPTRSHARGIRPTPNTQHRPAGLPHHVRPEDV
ncbi:hypothetical protein K491DRAFT_164412 [Lophiostoma macrostomum CBS 122681]|uniref:Uncharacterized protein n=1 Tax=Lophiostoma macrostomum CBS 122681 TaxID=1314788 RepID=A0A6A6TJZ5_9PLEO|nr:hypothetical protein K491DRAFT_164412 [Lophiostoma macrostomum CBS 122681]